MRKPVHVKPLTVRAAFILMLLVVVGLYGQDRKYVSVKRSLNLMGTTFEITVVTQDEEIGFINIEEAAAEIKRIEKLISSWDPDSETSRINRNAGIQPVAVSAELYRLIERCIEISAISNGAFDITYASLDRLWAFDGSMVLPPTSEEIRKALLGVGYRNIVLNQDDHSVFLRKKGMKIGFGGIGKGYAADKAKALLVSKLVPAGMINAAGDITTWGSRATGEKWLIGVANPPGRGNLISWVPLVESSVAISGNKRKYVNFNGRQYHDILDPRTGQPVSGIQSVTVFGKTAELCDALATAIFVLGRDQGLAMINQLGGAEAILEEDTGSMYRSNGILFELN